MSENRWTLTSPDLHHASTDFTVTANDFGLSQPAFSVHRRTLHGGLREGVEVVEIDNGHLRLSVLPTRGMSIWKGWLGDTAIGWDSPIRGPIHPQFVPLAEPSGLGFLDGFDEWLVRCGLVSNGARNSTPPAGSSTACTAGSPICRPADWNWISTSSAKKSASPARS